MDESTEDWYQAHARARVAAMRSPADARTFALSYNLLQLAQILMSDLEARVHRPRGLTLPGFRLMFKLWLLGPTQPGKLAEMSALTRPAVSNLVNTLERGGHVSRSGLTSDRRSLYIDLTEKGRAVVAEVFDLQLARERAWFSALPRVEQDRLIPMLRTLVEAHQPALMAEPPDGQASAWLRPRA